MIQLPRNHPTAGQRTGRRRAGLTLVELMVAMAVLLILIGLALYILLLALGSWSAAERERDAHDRAMGAIDVMRNDMAAIALSGSHSNTAVFQLYGFPRYGNNVTQDNSFLYFVRTIERGKERSSAYLAADGQPPVLLNEVPDAKLKLLPPLPGNLPANVDNEAFKSVENAPIASVAADLQALGGIMEVAYFVEQGKLYRYFRSPVVQPYAPNRVFARADCALVVDHVLFFGVQYWTPKTTSWDAPPLLGAKSLKAGEAGPETMWDSTRTDRDFTFFNPQGSTQPLFPQRIKITLVLDWDAHFHATATLADDIGANDGSIRLASAGDLPAGGRDDSYVLIGNEWIRYSYIDGDTLVLDPQSQDAPGQRGARGSAPDSHSAGDPVRFGRTFTYYLNLPQGDFFLPEEQP